MTNTSPKLTVEIWTDVICPWCWIGVTRFEKALAGFEHRDDVNVAHRSFRLMPGSPVRPVKEVLSERMGIPQSSVPAALRQVESTAAAEGLTYNLAETSTGDTTDAHRLIKFAATKGKSDEMLVRLYRAYLSEVRSVFDHESLSDLAQDVGFDRNEVLTMLEGEAFYEEIRQDQHGLQRLGGSGVPLFLIGGRYAISGAQPMAQFSDALNRAWAALPVQPELIGNGTVCDPDGCALP